MKVTDPIPRIKLTPNEAEARRMLARRLASVEARVFRALAHAKNSIVKDELMACVHDLVSVRNALFLQDLGRAERSPLSEVVEAGVSHD